MSSSTSISTTEAATREAATREAAAPDTVHPEQASEVSSEEVSRWNLLWDQLRAWLRQGVELLSAERWLRGLTSFLTSVVFHVLLLLLLAFLLVPGTGDRIVELSLGGSAAAPANLDLQVPVLEIESLDWDESLELLDQDLNVPKIPNLQSGAGSSTDEEVISPRPAWRDVMQREQLFRPSFAPVGGGWEGRDPTTRRRQALARGGTEESEEAVELGLQWLAAHQRADGSWRFNHLDRGCSACRNPGSASSTTGATALALLPFLGAGYTSQKGPYQEVVRRGIYYLTSRMLVTELGGDLQEGTMYAQGIATLALCEAYGMTRDPALRPVAQDAVNFICNVQHPRGGWRYLPGQPGDTTVFGWQIMALKSASMAGLDVPSPVIELAMSYLDSVQSTQGATYGYQKPGHDPAPTAIGLLARMYHGWRYQDPRLDQGVLFLDSIGPSLTDMYFNYYATQVLHHGEGPYWERWNERMRDHLVGTQATVGHERGSWHFSDQHGNVGGRLYTTAMCVMILEVYYRHMPLYDRRTVEEGW